MRTREEQIAELVDALKKPVCRPDYPVDILNLWLEKHILEAERRAEQRVRADMSVGYIFHNPDIGTEILPYHPVESGECLDAQDIRQATAEVLREELASTWEEMANYHREREKRGEESCKDSERLDWLDGQCVHVYAPKQYASGIGCGVCLASHRTGTDRNLRATIDAAREVG